MRPSLVALLGVSFLQLALHEPLHAQSPRANAEAVRSLIATADAGEAPLLWFESTPGRNSGRCGDEHVLTSGGAPAGRGLDPWGRTDGAFGPSADNAGGAAIVGSNAVPLIQGAAGGMLLFFMPPRDLVPPAMLFSRGDWNERSFLSLRLHKGDKDPNALVSMLGYADPTTGRSSQVQLAPVSRGYWMFAALSWRQNGDHTVLTHWTGSLGRGQLQRGELRIPNMTEGAAPVYVGGRKPGPDFPSPKLMLRDGLLCHFAITGSELRPDTVEAIFAAAIRR